MGTYQSSSIINDDDVEERSENVKAFIEEVEMNDEDSLSDYLREVWGGERSSTQIMAYSNAALDEYYLRVYFKAIMSIVEARLMKEKWP